MSDIKPLQSVRAMQRPLELARAIRVGPCTDVDGNPMPSAKALFAGAVPVVLDQVCDWWNTVPECEAVQRLSNGRSISASGRPWPDDRLEGSARLPWPKTWAEWVDRDPKIDGALKIGVMLCERPMGKADPRLQRMWPSASFYVSAQLVVQDDMQRAPPRVFHGVFWPARVDGTPFSNSDNDGWQYAAIDRRSLIGTEATATDLTWELLGVWRLFTALLAVKGTTLVDTHIPRHTRRAWSRLPDGPAHWITYKTLTIQLPRGARESAADDSTDPPPGVPLHLVRAYLADYRSGRGLFGKYRRLVWMPSHLRGRARLGAISKTYTANVAAIDSPQ